MKKSLIYLLVLVAPAYSFGSFANPDPNDIFATGPDQQHVDGGILGLNAFDQSVRVINTANQGSGSLIGRRSNITIDGEKYHKLSFVTADHVMDGKTLSKIGFEGSAFTDLLSLETITAGRFTATINPATNFQYTYSLGLRDMGFLGVTIKYAALTANQNKYLEQLNPLQIGVVGDDYRGAARSYGYGLSGFYQYDLNNAKVGFKLDPTGNPFGTHRYVNHTVKRGGNYTEGNYSYDQLSWDCSTAVGEGQLAPGDSGGAFMVNNKLAGVNTYVTETDNAFLGKYYKFGTAGGAYRLTADDKTWLLGQARDYQAVPEPTTILALAIGLASLKKRRQKAA